MLYCTDGSTGWEADATHPNLVHDTTLLEQVCENFGTADVIARIEVNLQQLAEARGVVIAQSLGIAESLQEGVGLQHLVLDTMPPGHLCEKLHRLLRCFCFPRSRLPTDDHTLALHSHGSVLQLGASASA